MGKCGLLISTSHVDFWKWYFRVIHNTHLEHEREDEVKTIEKQPDDTALEEEEENGLGWLWWVLGLGGAGGIGGIGDLGATLTFGIIPTLIWIAINLVL